MLRLQLYKDRVKKRGGHVTLLARRDAMRAALFREAPKLSVGPSPGYRGLELAVSGICRPEERVQNLFAFDNKKQAETAIKKYEDDAKKKALKHK